MTRPTLAADSPAPLIELANRFAEAKTLLTADELGLFGMLQSGPAGIDEISAKLGLHERPAPDFLAVLVALGLLDKLADGRFANSPAASRYLVPGGPDYIGSLLKNRTVALYPAWGRLTEAVTGADQKPGVDGGSRDNFAAVLEDPAKLRHMLDMLESLSGFLGPLLATAIDWNQYTTVIDLGGAHGYHLVDIVQAHPHLRAGVFELPQMGPYVAERAAASQLADRIAFHPGDFFVDPFPTASAYIFGHILHNFAPPTRETLVAKAYRALEPGGALLVIDRMIDEERADLAKLLESLHMFVVTRGGGNEYRASDCAGYMTSAGFTRTSVQGLTAAEILVIGHKEP